MRDKRKNISYFNEYIAEQIGGIKLFKTAFDNGGNGQLTKEIAADTIVSYYLDLLSSTYSNGGNNDELKIILTEMLPYLEYTEYYDSYVEALWVLSLAYILEIDASKLELLKQRILENKYNDYVVSTILNAIFPNEKINQNIIWDKPYAKLKPILDAKQNADVTVLKTYLEKYWYKGHSDCAWYESHKRENLAYAGYWSFETAALVKLFNLDDSILENVDYYPFDAVNW